MPHPIPRRILIVCAALLLPLVARAQPALPDVAPQFVVTYIEVAPAAADEASALLRTFRDAARQQPGAVRIEALRRLAAPHHFAVLAEWRDTAAFRADAEAPHAAAFRTALQPHLTAPYDERRHHALNTVAASVGPGALVTVTHVDIVPTEREPGIESIRALAGQSRGTPGNLRYDALLQSTRPNHATLVEAWADREAYVQHVISPHLRAFRTALLPRSGSLYDERQYIALD